MSMYIKHTAWFPYKLLQVRQCKMQVVHGCMWQSCDPVVCYPYCVPTVDVSVGDSLAPYGSHKTWSTRQPATQSTTMRPLYTVPNTYSIESCAQIYLWSRDTLYTGQPAGSQWCPLWRGSTVHVFMSTHYSHQIYHHPIAELLAIPTVTPTIHQQSPNNHWSLMYKDTPTYTHTRYLCRRVCYVQCRASASGPSAHTTQ